jgi:DNA-binding transcriptional regulator YdaS (Cro superfamily)
MEDPGLTAAREAAGGKNIDLAKLLGVTESAVSQWKRVPYQRAIEIEEKTEGRLTRHDLRPDVFGAPPKQKKGRAA